MPQPAGNLAELTCIDSKDAVVSVGSRTSRQTKDELLFRNVPVRQAEAGQSARSIGHFVFDMQLRNTVSTWLGGPNVAQGL